jgi:Family of unknown function (DUF5670)
MNNTDERGPLHPFPLDPEYNEEPAMLYTIAVILLILWLVGLVSSYTIGGLIHVLLVVAIVMVLLRVINGQKVAG